MDLRPYQAAAVETVRAHWAAGRRSVVLCAPTGAGKTAMAESLIRRVAAADWAQTFVLAHQWDLLAQPAASVQDIEHGFVKAGVRPNSVAPVQFAQVQSVVSRPVEPGVDRSGRPYRRCVVVWDECHRVRSSTCLRVRQSLLAAFDIVYFLLMSATPYRRDGRTLRTVADALVEAATPRQLIEAGYILEPAYYSRPVGAERDLTSALSESVSPEVVGDLVETWLLRSGGVPTVARCVNRAHSRDVVERFRRAGVRAEHVDGDATQPERDRLLARLATGGRASDHPLALDVLCTGGTLLEEGLDSLATYRLAHADPSLWVGGRPPRYRPLGCLVDAAPTTSRGAWVQRLGRVTRPHTAEHAARLAAALGAESDLKDRATVLCHSGNLERHGFLSQHEGFTLLQHDRAGTQRERDLAYPAYRPPATAQCPHCFATFRRPAASCPTCGGVVSAPPLPDEDTSVTLEPRKWDPSLLPPETDDQREGYLRHLWARWVRARDERTARGQAPYSTKWPAVQYRVKYGVYPDWSTDRAVARQFGVRQ